MTKAKERKSRY